MKATYILVPVVGGLALGLLLPGTALAGATGSRSGLPVGAGSVTAVAGAQSDAGERNNRQDDRNDGQDDGNDGDGDGDDGGRSGNRADGRGSDKGILAVVGGGTLLANALGGGVILARRRRHAIAATRR